MINHPLLPDNYTLDYALRDDQVENLIKGLLPQSETFIVSDSITIRLEDNVDKDIAKEVFGSMIKTAKDTALGSDPKITFIPFCDGHHHVLFTVLPPKNTTEEPRLLYFNSMVRDPAKEEKPSEKTGISFLEESVHDLFPNYTNISKDRQEGECCGLAISDVASMIARRYSRDNSDDMNIQPITEGQKQQYYANLIGEVRRKSILMAQDTPSDEIFATNQQILYEKHSPIKENQKQKDLELARKLQSEFEAEDRAQKTEQRKQEELSEKFIKKLLQEEGHNNHIQQPTTQQEAQKPKKIPKNKSKKISTTKLTSSDGFEGDSTLRTTTHITAKVELQKIPNEALNQSPEVSRNKTQSFSQEIKSYILKCIAFLMERFQLNAIKQNTSENENLPSEKIGNQSNTTQIQHTNEQNPYNASLNQVTAPIRTKNTQPRTPAKSP
ncbi:hypothetical protein SZ25_00069 [Candidatus Arcanobacter lacustris]|uniref:Uncharacterized protein n=1 Tax=Candidatus Arcanibacter lacustris TaxID=1607817 RepID=A0A0F5MQ68_9RICK|nr:hypothetical protein SZ25_00069 [Candidatus Arcanobacter lacustris]